MEVYSSGITFYDAATTIIFLTGFALLFVSVFFLFKERFDPIISIVWFAVIVILPIVGSLAFLLYLVQNRRN